MEMNKKYLWYLYIPDLVAQRATASMLDIMQLKLYLLSGCATDEEELNSNQPATLCLEVDP